MDERLNQWYKCKPTYLVYNENYFIRINKIEGNTKIYGDWIYYQTFSETGSWELDINSCELIPLNIDELNFVNELVNSRDHDNITIALTIINKKYESKISQIEEKMDC